MIDKGKILFGTGCLASGLGAGYFLSENGKSAVAPSHSIPPSNQYSERTKWLENLTTEKVAALIEALCTGVGPDGLKYSDQSFLDEALKKWWKVDRDGALKWAAFYRKSLLLRHDSRPCGKTIRSNSGG